MKKQAILTTKFLPNCFQISFSNVQTSRCFFCVRDDAQEYLETRKNEMTYGLNKCQNNI